MRRSRRGPRRWAPADRPGPAAARATDGLDDPGETFTQVVGPDGEVIISTPGLPRGPVLDAARREEAAEGLTIRLPVPVEPDEGDEDVDREALEETAEEPFESDRARVVARTVEADRTRYGIITGATLEDREDAVRALDRVLLIALPVSLLGATLAGWFALVAALRPVERMRRRAERISDRSLSERLPVPGTDDEIARLGRTLNEMLDRLELALETERSFAADASHELRTPLAVLRGELELALRRDRPPDELRAALAAALDETLRLNRLADDLLLMARSDAGRLELRPDLLDARALLEAVAARLGPVAGDRPVAVEAAPGIRLTADRDRLELALGNLVENALRHGDGPVALDAAAADGRVTFTVADRGPGVDSAFARRAFERFSRADAARSGDGAGLGLAIVRAVAVAHGGEARLEPRPGGGAVASLIVPSSPPA